MDITVFIDEETIEKEELLSGDLFEDKEREYE